MKWNLNAVFEATELEADGIGDILLAVLPAAAVIDFEPVEEN